MIKTESLNTSIATYRKRLPKAKGEKRNKKVL